MDPDPALTTVDLGGYDPLLGRTYAEIGSRARSMHKCQGMSQLVALPTALAGAQYRLAGTALPGSRPTGETSLFDGIDTTIDGLVRLAEANPPPALTRGLAALAREARAALREYEATGMTGVRAPLASGLEAVRSMRSALGGMALTAAAAEEIDLRLEAKERQFERAALLAHGVRLEVLADDGLVTPGQPLNVAVLAANQGTAGILVRGVRLVGFEAADASCGNEPLAGGGVYSCERAVRIPAGAAATDIHWRPRRRRRPLRLRSGGAVWRAVPPDPVSRGIRHRAGRHTNVRPASGGAPLRPAISLPARSGWSYMSRRSSRCR